MRMVIRRSVVLFALVLCVIFSVNSCKEKDSGLTHPAPKSKIAVVLTGKHATNEKAMVQIDGVDMGVITASAPVSLELNPGQHKVKALTINVPTDFSSTVDLKSGESRTVNLECDDAKVNVKVDGLYAADGLTFELVVAGSKVGSAILPGVPKTINNVDPCDDCLVKLIDNNGTVRYDVSWAIPYKSIVSVDLPYK